MWDPEKVRSEITRVWEIGDKNPEPDPDAHADWAWYLVGATSDGTIVCVLLRNAVSAGLSKKAGGSMLGEIWAPDPVGAYRQLILLMEGEISKLNPKNFCRASPQNAYGF